MGLAGRKAKQRIGHDPRNLSWADDAARFGQNYLSKFGWDASKGLGADMEGRTSHIKVSQKLDLMGIGAAHQNDPNGIAWKQSRDYENLLRRLNAANDGSELVQDEGGPSVLRGGWSAAKESGISMDIGGGQSGGEEESMAEDGVKSKRDKKKRKRKDVDDAEGEEGKRGKKKEKKNKKEKEEEQPRDVPSPAEKVASTTTSEMSTSEPISRPTTPGIPRHRAHRARVIAAKRLASQSATAMSEILGIAPTYTTASTSSSLAPSVSQTPQGTLTPVTADDVLGENLLITSTKSVAEYFKDRLAMKLKGGSDGSTPAATISKAGKKGEDDMSDRQRMRDEEDDAPRGGLGASRVRFSTAVTTREYIAEDEDRKVGIDTTIKFSSLMSSSFMKSAVMLKAETSSQEDKPEEAGQSKEERRKREKKERKEKNKSEHTGEGGTEGGSTQKEKRPKSSKKIKCKEKTASVTIEEDTTERKKSKKNKKKLKQSNIGDCSTPDDSTTVDVDCSTKGIEHNEERKREKARKRAEKREQAQTNKI